VGLCRLSWDIAKGLFGVGLEVANGTEWPTWNPGSEFRARRERTLREAGR
jgi:hypothetical protein